MWFQVWGFCCYTTASEWPHSWVSVSLKRLMAQMAFGCTCDFTSLYCSVILNILSTILTILSLKRGLQARLWKNMEALLCFLSWLDAGIKIKLVWLVFLLGHALPVFTKVWVSPRATCPWRTRLQEQVSIGTSGTTWNIIGTTDILGKWSNDPFPKRDLQDFPPDMLQCMVCCCGSISKGGV